MRTRVNALEWGTPETDAASARTVYEWATGRGSMTQTMIAAAMGLRIPDVNAFFDHYGIPRFDVGINYVPNDMLAMVHQGERILPAADNARLFSDNDSLLTMVRAVAGTLQGVKADTAIMVRRLTSLVDTVDMWNETGVPRGREVVA